MNLSKGIQIDKLERMNMFNKSRSKNYEREDCLFSIPLCLFAVLLIAPKFNEDADSSSDDDSNDDADTDDDDSADDDSVGDTWTDPNTNLTWEVNCNN